MVISPPSKFVANYSNSIEKTTIIVNFLEILWSLNFLRIPFGNCQSLSNQSNISVWTLLQQLADD
jgi:hypothetical protein